MQRSIQVNGEGYPFVFIPTAHAETLNLTKGQKVDIRIEGTEIRIVPIVAPTCKSELQQDVDRTPIEVFSHAV